MFKVYIRTVILYGIENLFLSEGEMNGLKNIESGILKKMLNIKQRCYTSELFRSLNIELTESWSFVSISISILFYAQFLRVTWREKFSQRYSYEHWKLL